LKPFICSDFLLENDTGKTLYHDHAAKMPIIDYHCHVSPKDIALDVNLENITNAWLGGDHYKWRMMRACGVDEKYITGDSSDKDKFLKFAESLPKAIGNPLYHWTHLELKRYFDCDLILSPENAEKIRKICNERLSQPDMTVRGIIKKSGVTHIGTTDDPIDTLEWHKMMQDDPTWDVNVFPTYRPDKAINIEKPGFAEYLRALSEASSININSFDDMCSALYNRMDFFALHGCNISDHGADYIPWSDDPENIARAVFKKALEGYVPDNRETDAYKTAILLRLAEGYAERGWVMQIHYGVARSVNSIMFNKLGPDTGFDCISTRDSSAALVRLLDEVNRTHALPKTILYSLNPNDDALLACASGAFQDSRAPGWVQHGSAWWFNDTKEGMAAQIKNLASMGVLGNFIGMLTDSRSFLSYTRHEYFRRILCNIIGVWVENGEYPADMEFLGKMVEDISYNNVERYLGL